ncbi:MAG TPA: hypothetical protein VMK13_16775 [Streptosporangiaceae bacterium]|nr:hypothetical protein [Streptosporangiaceae bacterium]
MSSSRFPRFPVTVTRLPVIRCQVCQRGIPCRSGQASAVLTEHYRREHPDVLDAARRSV